MPIFAAAALPLTMGAIGAGAMTGASIYGAKRTAGAYTEGGDLEAQAAREALAWEKEQEAFERAQYLEEYKRETRLFDERRARLAPYEQFGEQGRRRLASLL